MKAEAPTHFRIRPWSNAAGRIFVYQPAPRGACKPLGAPKTYHSGMRRSAGTYLERAMKSTRSRIFLADGRARNGGTKAGHRGARLAGADLDS